MFFIGSTFHWAPELYILITVGVQNESPQDVPLWNADYFKLKTIKAKKPQKESWAFSLMTIKKSLTK